MAPRDRRLVTAVTLPMLAAYGYRIGAALEGPRALACLAPSHTGAARQAPAPWSANRRRADTMTVPAVEVVPARRWAIDIPAEQRGSVLLLIGRGVQLVNGLLLSIVLVQRFGLATVGAFALGIAAVNLLATVCALGSAPTCRASTSRTGSRASRRCSSSSPNCRWWCRCCGSTRARRRTTRASGK
jgi:hypothetical protein